MVGVLRGFGGIGRLRCPLRKLESAFWNLLSLGFKIVAKGFTIIARHLANQITDGAVRVGFFARDRPRSPEEAPAEDFPFR